MVDGWIKSLVEHETRILLSGRLLIYHVFMWLSPLLRKSVLSLCYKSDGRCCLYIIPSIKNTTHLLLTWFCGPPQLSQYRMPTSALLMLPLSSALEHKSTKPNKSFLTGIVRVLLQSPLCLLWLCLWFYIGVSPLLRESICPSKAPDLFVRLWLSTSLFQ